MMAREYFEDGSWSTAEGELVPCPFLARINPPARVWYLVASSSELDFDARYKWDFMVPRTPIQMVRFRWAMMVLKLLDYEGENDTANYDESFDPRPDWLIAYDSDARRLRDLQAGNPQQEEEEEEEEEDD